MRFIDKVAYKIYNQIGIDGLLHILVSVVCCKVFAIMFQLPIAVIITFVIGILKEVYDLKTTNLFSWKDLICDFIGIMLTLFIILL